jgi:hypothetical protein
MTPNIDASEIAFAHARKAMLMALISGDVPCVCIWCGHPLHSKYALKRHILTSKRCAADRGQPHQQQQQQQQQTSSSSDRPALLQG